MFNGIFHIPAPLNEPYLQYAPGSDERVELKAKLKEMLGEQVDVPMIIDGEDVRSGQLADIRCPHDHHHILGRYHQADALFVTRAIDAAEKAKRQWGEMPWDSRAIVFLKAAELLAGIGMAAMFTFVLASALYRGLEISCGCFSASDAGIISYSTLIRTCVILLFSLAAYISVVILQPPLHAYRRIL